MLHYIRTAHNEKENLENREKLKKIQNMGLKMVKNKEIDLIESVSKINYANGLTFFSANGVATQEDESKITHFESIIQHNLDLLRS